MEATRLVIMFLQYFANGIFYSAVYGLVASGLSLIFGVLEVVNFAHGEFFMIGAFVFFLIFSISRNMILSIAGAVAVLVFLGILTEKIVTRRAVKVSWMAPIVATLGISLALQTLFLIIFTATPKMVITPISADVISIAGAQLGVPRLVVLAAALLSFIGLNWYIHHTKTGKAMRAISQSRSTAEIVGIDINRVSAITFAIGAGLSGLAGALIGPIQTAYPTMGLEPTLKAFTIVILGGFGNVKGAIYGAFIIGLGESLFEGYVSPAFKDILVFVLILVILLFKPEGIFGKKVGI